MYTSKDLTPEDKAFIDWKMSQPNGMGGTLADTYKAQGIKDFYSDARLIADAKEQNARSQRRLDMYQQSGQKAPSLYDRSGTDAGVKPWANPNWKEDMATRQANLDARNAAGRAQDIRNGVVVGGGVIKPDGTYVTSNTTGAGAGAGAGTSSGAPTVGNGSGSYDNSGINPAANTRSGAEPVMVHGHPVDPVTGHLLNPTLTAAQLQQARDGINTNAEMRQAYNAYWDTVKPGDILDFAGGTLTMNSDGSSTHTYTDASGRKQSYTFTKDTDFATVAKSDPNIAAEWKTMFNYSPSGTTGGGGGGGGYTGMGEVVDKYTAGGGHTGYTPYVPANMDDFNAKYNKQGGGSKQAYDYLTGKTEYSPVPYTKDGQIQKSYAESVLGIPQDISTKKYLFQNGKYVVNPAFRPPKPVVTPAEGKEWTWDDTNKKWTETNKKPVVEEANGGLLALAGGGMAERYNLGGYSDGGRLLRGPGDGVSDSIPATIGHKQPARLADGEFVVPARIVSELGNGSTEAGARKLYAMMDRVQQARRQSVGKGKVAKNSRADKYLPS
jgi:hypothetical protein